MATEVGRNYSEQFLPFAYGLRDPSMKPRGRDERGVTHLSYMPIAKSASDWETSG